MKRGRISLSFGYLTEADREGSDGVKELTQIDLMEVTLTSTPANPDARVLSAKSIDERRYEVSGQSMSYAEMMEEIEAKDLATEKKARPIQIASFRC